MLSQEMQGCALNQTRGAYYHRVAQTNKSHGRCPQISHERHKDLDTAELRVYDTVYLANEIHDLTSHQHMQVG